MTHDERVAYADQIRRARLERGMTQAELAAAAGVVRQTVSNIEAGGRVPQEGVLKRLMAVLGIETAGSIYSQETQLWLGLIGGVLENVPSDRRAIAGKSALDAVTGELMSAIPGMDGDAPEDRYGLAASRRSADRGEDTDY